MSIVVNVSLFNKSSNLFLTILDSFSKKGLQKSFLKMTHLYRCHLPFPPRCLYYFKVRVSLYTDKQFEHGGTLFKKIKQLRKVKITRADTMPMVL